MASTEGGSVPSGVGFGEGCPLSSRLRGLGERRELPQRSPGLRAPAENRFWRILKATERSFLYLYDQIWAGTICISVPPAPNSGGSLSSLSPRDLCPWSYIHVQPRRHTVEMYASTAKVHMVSLRPWPLRNILHLQTVFVSCLFKMLSGRSVLYYNKFRILLAAKSKNNNNILRRWSFLVVITLECRSANIAARWSAYRKWLTSFSSA